MNARQRRKDRRIDARIDAGIARDIEAHMACRREISVAHAAALKAEVDAYFRSMLPDDQAVRPVCGVAMIKMPTTVCGEVTETVTEDGQRLLVLTIPPLSPEEQAEAERVEAYFAECFPGTQLRLR